jgi:arylsulfatase A
MRYFPVGLVVLCAVAFSARAERPPNVIVILADDLGYGDLSCYGGSIQTPHIDRLAAEGLRFTDFHASGPVCSPTRAGLLTGRYQQRAGIPDVVFANPDRNRHHGLQPHEITLARLLKDAGYVTGLVGKWHLGYEPRYNPTVHGFDFFRGYVSGNIDYFSHLDSTGIHDWWHGTQRVQENGYVTHLITRHALRFIENHTDHPFFLYIAHEAPHYPYQGPGDAPLRTPGEGGQFHRGENPQQTKTAYRQMIEEMDKSTGQVMETLRRLKIDHNTLVFFFSDNGPVRGVGSSGPWRGDKGTLWEGGHRVPAIAHWPGRIPPGVSDELATSLDIMPTALKLAGAEPPRGHRLDGVDLCGLLLERSPLGERIVFWQYGSQRAVRHGPWKFAVDVPGQTGEALYHLGEDPGEQSNRAAEHPQRVEEMRRALEMWEREVAREPTVQPSKR